ncbi:hypothetical protein VTL71DRAFT_1232 [Oculimacula yallundae]|uniref:1,3-beta-glucanosyltransferase n=1 Tax=Oculimacula yallundae TaxID=86028 RepID=A0ABR4CA42_9HELO
MFKHILAIALLACLTFQAFALPTITVKGSKFFAGGQQYFLKGVAYQGTPNDPLEDTAQCQLDAKSMQSIGTNSIRVYHVDPAANHDGCMSAFRDAGVYIWLDLDTFTTSIIQATPWWTKEQFSAFAKVMDAFQQYDNLGGFWIGNEVITSLGGGNAAPFIKAAVADMKAYMTVKGYRSIPVGYSAADIAELRPMLQYYLACGDPDEAIDFFGLNSYEWCGAATYENSGYVGLQAMAVGYNLPIFFSETGCNIGGERTFNDQKAIFGPEMIDTWSGSIVYEWVQETNDYGIVDYPNGQIYSGAPIPIQPDFNNLANVWKEIKPAGVSEASYTPEFSPPACPAATGGWPVNENVPLPRLDSSIIKAVASGAQYGTQIAPPRQTPISSAVGSTGMPTSLLTSHSVSVSESPPVSSSLSPSVSKSESSLPSPSVSKSESSTSVSSQVSLVSRMPMLSSTLVISSMDDGLMIIAVPSTHPADSASTFVLIAPSTTTMTLPTTTPTAAPAATTTTSRSAGTALKATSPIEWFKHANTLGGKGGLVGLLILRWGWDDACTSTNDPERGSVVSEGGSAWLGNELSDIEKIFLKARTRKEKVRKGVRDSVCSIGSFRRGLRVGVGRVRGAKGMPLGMWKGKRKEIGKGMGKGKGKERARVRDVEWGDVRVGNA